MERNNMTQQTHYHMVHIDTIRVGDIVFHDDQERTVGQANLKPHGFDGTTLWGDSYRLGTLPVMLRNDIH